MQKLGFQERGLARKKFLRRHLLSTVIVAILLFLYVGDAARPGTWETLLARSVEYYQEIFSRFLHLPEICLSDLGNDFEKKQCKRFLGASFYSVGFRVCSSIWKRIIFGYSGGDFYCAL